MITRKILSILILIVAVHMVLSKNAHAYLDPGTGSYIFQVLMAGLIGGLYAIKVYWQKIKNFFSERFPRKDRGLSDKSNDSDGSNN